MQAFFKTHKYLLEHLDVPVKRELSGEIDWSHRLIGIQGARGVGKTTFLLNHALTTYGFEKSCLYVNLNNLYFADRSIVSFADEFRKTGGKTLILDQVYKYPNWSSELRYCYDHFTDLQIIFSGSSVMRVASGNPDLENCVASYTLEGFSFREYLNLKAGTSFQSYSLNDLLVHHQDISQQVISKVKPLAFFNDYLHHGYYPFFLEQRNYLENLLKNVNLTLEIDISYLEQIELKYLPKLRRLLYLAGLMAPFQPNVSKLSIDVETSRATVMNYLNHLKQARLINLLYEGEEEPMKKPTLVYLQNPNLVYSVAQGEVEPNLLHKTFFYNQVGTRHHIGAAKLGDFVVDRELVFQVGGRFLDVQNQTRGVYCARDMIEVGEGNQIPLWLFGFLY
jgi:hypothetical protein